MAHIDYLPREILLKIFSYYLETETHLSLIGNISKVCQCWEELCWDSSLWRTFDGSLLRTLKMCCENGSLINTELLVFSRIETVKKQGNLHEDTSTFQLIYENLPHLKSINFSKVVKNIGKDEWDFFSELLCHCPNLCELTFNESYSHDPPKLALKNLLDNFLMIHGANLISLDFSNLAIPSLKMLFVAVASFCPNLECLIAQNVHGQNLSFPIQSMQKGLKKLKTLRLGYPVCLQSCSSIKDISGFQNLDTFTHPSKIDSNLKDSYFHKLLMDSPNLKVLDIRGCVLLTPAALCSLPANNLERLYVSNTRLYEHREFADVLKKWGHSLVALDVSKMKGSSINDLFKMLISIGSLQNLESVELHSTKVTASTVKLLVQNCPKLNFIQLESCRSLGRGRKRAYRSQTEIKQLLNLEDEMDVT